MYRIIKCHYPEDYYHRRDKLTSDSVTFMCTPMSERDYGKILLKYLGYCPEKILVTQFS
jgi:hypothetical protein